MHMQRRDFEILKISTRLIDFNSFVHENNRVVGIFFNFIFVIVVGVVAACHLCINKKKIVVVYLKNNELMNKCTYERMNELYAL